MKEIDVRFSADEISIFKNMIVKIKCDPFEFSTSVYGIVALMIRNIL